MGEVKQWPVVPRPIPPNAKHANDLPYSEEEADRIYKQRLVEYRQRAYEAQRRADAAILSLRGWLLFGIIVALAVGCGLFFGS